MATLWNSDDELFELARKELYTAVVGDVMDKMGLTHQFLPPQVQPLDAEMVTVGRAMTVLEGDCFEVVSATDANAVLAKPFGLMLEALDDLKPNEVYVCAGASPRYALWGELMTTRAIRLGAVGAVLDGYSRDTAGILELGFPTFSYGCYAQDQAPRGKVLDFRIRVEIGEAAIDPGDILFGDRDGVCVIPRGAEEEAFARALEKARGEKQVKNAIEAGMSAVEAFARYGIM